jgi:type IV pilus assembly protein PilE
MTPTSLGIYQTHSPRGTYRKRPLRGFTLIELMVVVAIVAILASVAFPSYIRYVNRTHRGDATAKLEEARQYMEMFYGANNYNYATTTAGANVVLKPSVAVAPEGAVGTQVRYNISFQGAPTRNTFVLQAVPVNAQATDECGTLTLNQAGTRGVQRSTVANCWR